MASERAMVVGFCGSISSFEFFTASAIGEQPVACAPKNFTGLRFNKPQRHQVRRNALLIFVISEPPAIGTTTLSGKRQPSCSAIS